nr:crosslink repair DNA glycosylase YcaQ family protein [Pseudolysinimonas kribbensis]
MGARGRRAHPGAARGRGLGDGGRRRDRRAAARDRCRGPGADLFRFEPQELDELVTLEVGGSALFASRFRESAARALLLPRMNPTRRSPLWQQRQRSAQLLEVARKYPSFPIILETVREVLQDVYDLPSLHTLATDLQANRVRMVEVETDVPSPFARSLLFGYVAAFLYEGDSPLAERRAAALSLDPTLLAELLGRAELRELLDPEVIEQTELELQRLAPDRRARDAEGVVDLLRVLGPLTLAEIHARSSLSPIGVTEPIGDPNWDLSRALGELARANRVLRATVAGEERWAVIEDASRLRDALGVPLPIGVPSAFLDPVADPVGDLVSRYVRTHGPFTAADAAARLGLGVAVVLDALRRLAADRRAVEGEFRPGATGSEWVDAEVLRRLRARSLAALRSEVEPVPQRALGRFLPDWHHVGALELKGEAISGLSRDASAEARLGPRVTAPRPALRGVDGVVAAIEQLGGVALPASAWEALILPSRVRDFLPMMLDELTTTGEVLWSGRGELPGGDGWLALHLAESAPLTLPAPALDEPALADATELHDRILLALTGGGAFFFRQLQQTLAATGPADDTDLARALWDLVWAGLVTNDTLAPLRARLGATTYRPRKPTRRPGRPSAPASLRRPDMTSASRSSAPPTVAGRWSLLPQPETATTVRAAALAEQLLDRHGIVTRGAVQSEGVAGGFALAYKVLAGLEETGRTRRGYFVEGLGAAQFATPATVDRVRAFAPEPEEHDDLVALTLAATDPANPYGAAIGWPAPPADAGSGHRPGRKAGALVVLVDGGLALYVERGGKTVLDLLPHDDADRTVAARAAAAASLAATVRATGGRLRVEKVDGAFAVGTPLGDALVAAGFATTPQGLRLRG